MKALRLRFWDDDEAIFKGRKFSEILKEDILNILADVEERGYDRIPVSHLNHALRNSRMRGMVSTLWRADHCWSIDNATANSIAEIAEELGFTIVKPLHWRSKKPLKIGEAITL